MDATLTGKIDIFDPEEQIVYDLKASDDSKWFDREQGLFYSLIIYKITGRLPARFGQFVYLRLKNVVWQEISKRFLMEIPGKVRKVVGKIEGEAFNNAKMKISAINVTGNRFVKILICDIYITVD